ncbi:MAG TPA: alpha-galactosidase [Planctomycetota bacterium]|nr:alpha-galactosidase [Planctomycetota bacterium]
MAKISFIGAGSIVFAKTIMMDIMATPGLEDSEICLMNRGKPKLGRIKAFANRVVKDNKLPTKITATLDAREAMDGADYVVNMFDTGGAAAYEHDYKVPLKYGVDQCIGDTLGPGGVFRALRTIPIVVAYAKMMESLCPDALLLNYVNPMAAVCYALGQEAKVQFVGLCHGVQTTIDLIAHVLGEKKEALSYFAAGINHMAWFLKLEKDGVDLYPLFRALCEKPAVYKIEKVRIETMRHFGYFMTESTGHLSEYLPYFRKTRKALDTYCDEPAFGGESGAYYKYAKALARKFAKVDPLELETTQLSPPSAEYCTHIIKAHTTGEPFRLNGNVRNDGLITNLTQGCCVEVPCFIDKMGIYPTRVGALPPQCAGLNQTNVTVQGLACQAALTGDPELAFAACALDPLASAVCTLHEIREMVREMLAKEAAWLPQFDGRTLAARKPVKVTAKTKGIEAPLDPALAIGNRFGQLATMKVKKAKK